jgi:hypothetical protein
MTRQEGPEDGFWIHLDADVLDETIMQAVDDPRPGGLAWDELVSALSMAVRSGHGAQGPGRAHPERGGQRPRDDQRHDARVGQRMQIATILDRCRSTA